MTVVHISLYWDTVLISRSILSGPGYPWIVTMYIFCYQEVCRDVEICVIRTYCCSFPCFADPPQHPLHGFPYRHPVTLNPIQCNPAFLLLLASPFYIYNRCLCPCPSLLNRLNRGGYIEPRPCISQETERHAYTLVILFLVMQSCMSYRRREAVQSM